MRHQLQPGRAPENEWELRPLAKSSHVRWFPRQLGVCSMLTNGE